MGYGSAVSVSVFLAIFLLSLIYIRAAGSRLLEKNA
jgi:ABC-type sugar transport system permease subunit